MKNNEITVVIPCHNAKDTIEKCIESVYAQSYAVKEIIVIDDGSEDNTFEILEKLKKNYASYPTELQILTQANSGPSVSRNKGIKTAKSFWIGFLDADDYWSPEKLKKQIEFLDQHKDFVLCGSKKLKNKKPYKSITFKQLLYRNEFTPTSVLVKKDVLLTILFNEQQRYMEDQLLWLQIAKKHQIALLNADYFHQINPKAVFGEAGLSSNLWEMEKGELSNYKKLLNIKYISLAQYLFLVPFSFLKFLRRVIICKSKKNRNKEKRE